MNYKIITFDVSNTLIYDKNTYKVDDLLLDDLNKLRNKGYILGISTLRSKEMIYKLLEQFNFDFLILFNGSKVYVNDTLLLDKPFNKDELSKLINEANKLNIDYKLYETNNNIYALTLLDAKDRIFIDSKFNKTIWDITKNIDVVNNNLSKLNALIKVCEYYNVKLDEVISFGDGFNDIDIIKHSGIGVAMGGAPEELVKVCDLVSDTAKNNGISKALRRLEIL